MGINAKKKGMKKCVCKQCGNIFFNRKMGKNHKLLFCSLKCKGMSQIKYYSEEERFKANRANQRKWARNNWENNKEKCLAINRKNWKIRARKKGILPHISKEENEFYQKLLEQFKPEEILRNTRKIIKNPITNYPLELDFYIPKEKKAIEINGFCHRELARGGIEKLSERQRNDEIKKQECERLGIKLEIINV